MRNRVLIRALKRLEPYEGKLSRTVLRGLRGSNVSRPPDNPELTKTGLDLLHFPTLIFMEITFNLSTMMQASARAYRLNQTHAVCKTVYMYAQGTMEHTAVQLMSRKQRAAKLLTGDLGLTGLDALTEGESGFESALMEAIAKDDALLDPSALFKSDTGNDYDTEDAAFWNVETEADSPEEEPAPTLRLLPAQQSLGSAVRKRVKAAGLTDEARVSAVVGRVVTALTRGVPHPTDGDRMQCEGTTHPDFAKYPVHAEQLTKWLTKYLRSKKVAVEPETLKALAGDLVQLAATKAGIVLPTLFPLSHDYTG